ncbi:MAG: hypothetical protein ABIZ80_16040, partial [Bryobacteraceae bacterium]
SRNSLRLLAALPNPIEVRFNKRLAQAGLILPWSYAAGTSDSHISLAPLVAAVWARAGSTTPMTEDVEFRPWSAHTGPVLEISLQYKLRPPQIVTAGLSQSPVLPVTFLRDSAHSDSPSTRMASEPVLPSSAEKNPASSLLAGKRNASPQIPAQKWRMPSMAPTRPDLRSTTRVARSSRYEDEDLFQFDASAAARSKRIGQPWHAAMIQAVPSAPALFGAISLIFLLAAGILFLTLPGSGGGAGGASQWDGLRAMLRNRAVLKLEDDFRFGLSGWDGPSGWSKDWSYDQAGFLRPGSLGFLRESMKLKDYRLEFLGQIERKSLGWVFRASDEGNYYAAKLVIAKPGPLPMVDLVQYAVANGEAGPKIRVPLPFPVRNDTIYQVQLNVKGDHFSTTVNGHFVNSWTDKLLRAGGVGLLSERGEASRVRWIRVSDRDDFLGRVCSYLSARGPQPTAEFVLSSAPLYLFARPPL